MGLIFKTDMLIYQSKANLDHKILFVKITHHLDLEIRKMPVRGFLWESNFPRSILVHDLCGIEVDIVNFRKRILISIASNLYNRMELGILVPKHSSCKHFPNFWVEMNDLPSKIFYVSL